MIKQGNSYIQGEHLAFVVGKEFKTVSNIPTLVEEQAQKFIASGDATDYIKLGSQFIFFIKENDDLEKLRVAGHEVDRSWIKQLKPSIFQGMELQL